MQKSQYQVGIGVESVRGVKSSNIVWYPVTVADMNAEGESKKKKVARGKIASQAGSFILKKSSKPKIEGFMNDKVFHHIMKSLMGGYTFAEDTPVAGANTHSVVPAESTQHPSMTVIIISPIKTEMATGCMISRMGVKLMAGEICVNDIEFDGTFPVADTSEATFIEENDFTSDHVSIKLADDLAGLAAAEEIDVEELTLDFNKNTSSSTALGDPSPKKIFNGSIDITGSLKTLYENEDFYNQWKESASKALGIYIENTDKPITGTTYPKISIEIGDFKITDAPNPEGDIETIARTTGNFEANLPFGQDHLASIALINNQPELT